MVISPSSNIGGGHAVADPGGGGGRGDHPPL